MAFLCIHWGFALRHAPADSWTSSSFESQDITPYRENSRSVASAVLPRTLALLGVLFMTEDMPSAVWSNGLSKSIEHADGLLLAALSPSPCVQAREHISPSTDV